MLNNAELMFKILGTLATAIASVIGAITAYRKARAAYAQHIINRAMKKSENKGTLAGLAASVAEIMMELKPNSGHSLRDVVDGMAREVHELGDRMMMVDAVNQALASNDRRVAMFRTNGHGGFEWVNEKWRQLTGLGEEQSYAYGWFSGIHEGDRARVAEEWERVIEQQRTFDMRFRLWHYETGVVTEVRARAEHVSSAKGRPIGWVGSCTVVEKETL